MSEKYKFHDPDGIYFVTSTIVHWIDLFTRPIYKHVIIDALRYCQLEKGLVIHAWCIMPSHLHMIISSSSQSLSDIMRDFKKFTSKKIVEEITSINESRAEWMLNLFKQSGTGKQRIKKYKAWQDGNHPILLQSARIQGQKLDYIHNNPIKAEIVDEPENYWYSSARDYAGKQGFLNIELIE